MALGYQRIHDLSPLSIKLLNDQLEQLWKKMMGGLETRDLTQPLQAQINSAVTQDQVSSIIEQTAGEISMQVSSSGGDNLIRNGTGDFGTENWEVKASNVQIAQEGGQCYFHLTFSTDMVQKEISLRKDVRYTLGFDFRSQTGTVRATIGDTEGEWMVGKVWTAYKMPFTPTQSGEYTLKIEAAGVTDIARIMLCEGESVGRWRQNPNEIHTSSITITDERVSIGTKEFELKLYGDDGTSITEMTADSQGFSTLYIAQDLMMRGKPLYLGEGRYDLWVHPDAGTTGERRYYLTGDSPPPDLSGCFPDVQEAVDFIPRWCDGQVFIHVMGGSTWQYPSSRIIISNFFGGGSVTVKPWDAQRYLVKRMEIVNNSLLVSVYDADINSCSIYDQFRAENSVVRLSGCRVNGRGMLVSTGGFYAAYNAQLLLIMCEAHNCWAGAFATAGGRIYIEGAAGSNNRYGTLAATGGLVTQSVTTFDGQDINHELNGGKVLTPITYTKAGTLPDVTPMEWSETFDAIRSASHDGANWTTLPDWPHIGGNLERGFIWFDNAAIRAKLNGKTIVYASLTLRRRGSGGRAGKVPIKLMGCENDGPTGTVALKTFYGTVGSWAWGERRTISLKTAAVADLLAGTVAGFVITGDEEIDFEGVSQGYARLEVVYR